MCFNYLTPWSWVLIEKLTRPKLLKKFPAFYGTRRFITAFTWARHLSSWTRSIQCMLLPPPPNRTTRRSILILSSHLRLDLSSDSFPQVFPLKPCMHLCSPQTCYMPSLSQTSGLDHPNGIWWGVQSIKHLVLNMLYYLNVEIYRRIILMFLRWLCPDNRIETCEIATVKHRLITVLTEQ
jgi:hypothetical protein